MNASVKNFGVFMRPLAEADLIALRSAIGMDFLGNNGGQ